MEPPGVEASRNIGPVVDGIAFAWILNKQPAANFYPVWQTTPMSWSRDVGPACSTGWALATTQSGRAIRELSMVRIGPSVKAAT